mgnify:CR=1 FL=1
MRLFGVDADSFKIAVAIFDNSKLVGTMVLFANKKEKPDDRAFCMFVEFSKLLDNMKPDMMVTEQSLYNQNFKSSRIIAEVIGFCKLACEQRKIPFVLVYVPSWKKFITGKGNATKEEIFKTMLERHPGHKNVTQDEADAISIGDYFLHSIEQQKMKEENDER